LEAATEEPQASLNPVGAVSTQDWEAENYVEEQSLQSLVERLNDKGEKEVTRVVKVGWVVLRLRILMVVYRI